LGAQLLRHALTGEYPAYDERREESSLGLLLDDLVRQYGTTFEFINNIDHRSTVAPIQAVRRSNGVTTLVALSSPIAVDVPTSRALHADRSIFVIDDLLIRRNLPRATVSVFERLK
jgi:hypothetical protein